MGKTSYERHAEFGHHMSRYSPNGRCIIEECDNCGQRWLHDPLLARDGWGPQQLQMCQDLYPDWEPQPCEPTKS